MRKVPSVRSVDYQFTLSSPCSSKIITEEKGSRSYITSQLFLPPSCRLHPAAQRTSESTKGRRGTANFPETVGWLPNDSPDTFTKRRVMMNFSPTLSSEYHVLHTNNVEQWRTSLHSHPGYRFYLSLHTSSDTLTDGSFIEISFPSMKQVFNKMWPQGFRWCSWSELEQSIRVFIIWDRSFFPIFATHIEIIFCVKIWL